jgi:cyanophycin synthetase
MDNPVTLKLAGDRPLTYKMLVEAGLTVPEFMPFNLKGIHEAEEFVRAMSNAVIVKPASGTSGGHGITSGVTNVTQLRKAAAFASIGNKTLIVEKMISGDCYRLLYLDGELLDAVVRYRPVIVGDGVSRIGQLIEIENRCRISNAEISSLSTISLDLDLKWTLKSQGLSLRSVPHANQTVPIKTVVNEGSAAECESVTSSIGQELRDEGAAAARALGVRLAGVEVITTDPSVSLQKSIGAIIEVNTTPGLHHHYLVRNDSSRPATKILQHIFDTGSANLSSELVPK